MTEGSFSPLLSSFLHLCFCRSHSQFPSPFSHSPIPADFFTSCLPLSLFSNTCLCKHSTLAHTHTNTVTVFHCLLLRNSLFLKIFQSFLSRFNLLGFPWHLVSSTPPPSPESSPTLLLRSCTPHMSGMEDKSWWAGWKSSTWFDQCPPPA